MPTRFFVHGGMLSGEPHHGVLAGAGRSLDELELVGGMRPVFGDDESPSPLEPALGQLPDMLERGFTTVCIKPSQYLDDVGRFPEWCTEVVARVEEVAHGHAAAGLHS